MENPEIWISTNKFEKTFLFKYGMGLGFALIVGLFITAYIIRIPSYVEFNIVVKSINSSDRLTAKGSGYFNFLMKDGSYGQEGTVIGYLSNEISYHDIAYVKKIINSCYDCKVNNAILDSASAITGNSRFTTAYSNFKIALKKMLQTKEMIKAIGEKKNLIKRQESQLKNISKIYNSRIKLKNELINMKEQRNEIDSFLLAKRVITKKEYADSRENFLNSKDQSYNSDLDLYRNNLQILNLKNNLIDESLNLNQQLLAANSELNNSINNLKGLINEWEERNVIRFLRNGYLNISDTFIDGHFINEGAVVCYISTTKKAIIQKFNSDKYTAVGDVERRDLHYIKKAQFLRIEIDGYNVNDYGFLEGSVDRYYSFSNTNFNKILIHLPSGLTTSTNKKIKFVENMAGKAFLKKTNERMLEKILKNYINILKF